MNLTQTQVDAEFVGIVARLMDVFATAEKIVAFDDILDNLHTVTDLA